LLTLRARRRVAGRSQAHDASVLNIEEKTGSLRERRGALWPLAETGSGVI
jgi:hypothetical protein